VSLSFLRNGSDTRKPKLSVLKINRCLYENSQKTIDFTKNEEQEN